MSYGFVYDSEKTEEHEIGTGYGKKADLIFLTVFFALIVLAVVVRILVFPKNEIAGFLRTTSHGNVLTDENTETQIAFDSAEEYTQTTGWQVLEIQEMPEKNIEGMVVIALPEGTANSDISFTDHYRDRAFTVSVAETSKADVQNISVYAENSGSNPVVNSAAARYSGNELQISVTMNGIFEYSTEPENGQLIVKYFSPAVVYDHVVVIDPVENYNDDIAALVAEEVEEIAAQQGIKVYITRETDGSRSEAERLALMIDADPDLVLQLGVSSSADSSKYGLSAYYNGKFYMPDMNNVSLADVLLKDTTIAVNNRALSITEIDDDNILMLVDTPSAGLNIGYISNEEEKSLLDDADYRTEIAEGIVAALQEIFNEN